MAYAAKNQELYTTRAVCFLPGNALGFLACSREGSLREFVWLGNSTFPVNKLENRREQIFTLRGVEIEIGPALLFAQSLTERRIRLFYEESDQRVWGLYIRRDQRGDPQLFQRVSGWFS